ncbi:MAG: zinc ribbon domain-containing protein [Gemmatimonadaceae bacterium]
MDDLDRLYRRLVHNIRANRPEYLQIPFSVRELYEQIIPYRHNRRELGIETNDDYEVSVARLLSGERGYLQGEPAMQEELRRELALPTGDPGVFKGYGDATVSLTPAPGDTRTPATGTAAAGMRTPAVSATQATQATQATLVAPVASAGAETANAMNSVDGVSSLDYGDSGITATSDDTVMSATQAAPRTDTPVAAVATMPDAAPATAPETPVPSILSTLSQIEVPTGCRFCGGTLPEGRDANYCPHCGENLRTKRCPACGSEMDTSWGFCVTCGRKSGQ